jgi:hypothetical protein
MTERQPHQLIQRFDSFELRQYPKHVLVEVITRGPFMQAGSMGFRPLVSYISGRNIDGKKFAMTAPVLQTPNKTDDEHVVAFVLPAGVSIKDVPTPVDGYVTTRVVEEHKVAAVVFGGGWNENRFKSIAVQLRKDVVAAGLKPVGEVYLARFDPPWKPGFLKHNEALLDLE